MTITGASIAALLMATPSTAAPAHSQSPSNATSGAIAASATSTAGRQTITGASISAALVNPVNNGSASQQLAATAQRPATTPPSSISLNTSSNPINAYVGNLVSQPLAFPVNGPVFFSSMSNPSRMQQVISVLRQPSGYQILAQNPGLYGFQSPSYRYR